MEVYKDDKNDEVMKSIQGFANHQITSFQNLTPAKIGDLICKSAPEFFQTPFSSGSQHF